MNPVPGKMFDGDPYEDEGKQFWNYGPGAMCWYIGPTGRRFLRLLTPHQNREQEYVSLPVKPYEGQMASWEWDGNLERPTLTPSIDILTTGGWHGYVTNGNLVFHSWNTQAGVEAKLEAGKKTRA